MTYNFRNFNQSVNYAETSDAESDQNAQNRIAVCTIPATKLGNG